MTQIHPCFNYLEDQIGPLEKNLKAGSKHPGRKEVHRLRVNLRRIRTILEVSEDSNLSTLTVHERSELSKIWKLTGKVSDLRIAEINANKMHLDKELLRTKRKESQRLLKSKLIEIDIPGFTGIFEKLHQRLKYEKISLDPYIERLKKELASPVKDIEDIHEFRIAFKKTRYVLESMDKDIESFKYYQDQFGELNDLDTLRSYFEKNKYLEKLLASKASSCIKLIPVARKTALKALAQIK